MPGDMRLWIAAGLMVAPGVARADEIVVLGGSAELARGLEARGHRVARAERLDGDAVPGDRAAAVRADAARGREALFGRADFGGAVSSLERAAVALPAAGLEHFDATELARLHLDLGLAHLGAGAETAADGDLAWALRLDPALALDPAVHGPPVRRAVERLRAEALAAPRVSLAVRTEPAGARVTIDAQVVGASPVDHAVAVGPHYVLATQDGRRPASARVLAGPSGAQVSLVLRAAPPAADVEAALRAGDLERAARRLPAARRVDAAVAVRRAPGRWSALLVRPGVAERRLDAPSEAALVERLADALGPTEQRAGGARPGEGAPAWVWVGSAAIVVAAGIVAAALLVRSSNEDGRVLAGEIE